MVTLRRRRMPDGRGPFPVEGGEPYIEPSTSIQEVRRSPRFGFVRDIGEKVFDPYGRDTEYSPESDLLPLGEGLSGYFEGTRTPTEVQLAREQTEQLRRQITDADDARRVQQQIENAKQQLIFELATLPGAIGGLGPSEQRLESALASVAGRPITSSTPVPVARAQLGHDFAQLPQEQRAQVLEATAKPQTFTDSTGRQVQRIYPQPYRAPAARPYTRRVPNK